MQFVNILYHLALSGWLGGTALFTFLLTPTLFAAFSRDMAGAIVGALFPGYFRWGLACGGVALLCQLVQRGRFALASMLILAAMLLLTSIQALVIEPKATELKRSIASFDTTPKDDPVRARFRKLHGLSMAANLAVIGGGVILVILASQPAAAPIGRSTPETPAALSGHKAP